MYKRESKHIPIKECGSLMIAQPSRGVRDHNLHHNENQMNDIQTLHNTWGILPMLPKAQLILHPVYHYHIDQNTLRYILGSRLIHHCLPTPSPRS